MTISQNELLAMLADELDAARLQLDALGDRLIGDADVVARHISALQALDHVAQRCASVAAILRADDRHAATLTASLESITERLAALVGG